MATESEAKPGLITLEEFLRLPHIDDHPHQEFIDGRIEAKVSPQKKHSRLAKAFVRVLDDFAGPRGLGEAFVEIRCTFGGRSIIPDVTFLRAQHIAADANGEIADNTACPPDIHIEIISPDQTKRDAHRNLLHSVAHRCSLGILVHPYRRTIDVYRPGEATERLPRDGVIDGDPVLPGFRLSAAEVFGWLGGPPRGADPA